MFNNPPEELKPLVERVRSYADYEFDGTFPEIPGKTYTYNANLFKYMEAKAFMYLMTGEELYGYEAILCAKNCILTMVYTAEIFKDTYRGANHAMTVITEIYDWCYDLLTEEDKKQIIDGARFYLLNTLEFTYPPSNMGYVSGHGMSYQFLHTYVGFSLAIFDERPDWWDFVGGRFYSQYAMGINYCVKSGYYSQGTTCYAPGKLYNIYISSWIVESATGAYPYDHGLRDVPYFMLSQLMPNNRYFEYGDSPTSGYGASVDPSWMIIAVGMYNDPTVYAAAKKFSNNFSNINENDFGSRISAPMALVFLSGCAGSKEKFAENLPLIEYTGSPAGITAARAAWNDENAPSVFMKVGELNMANHDHRDSGTFQIYYKGLLAPANDGQYNVYGSEHWRYYHQATVSDNGLLVFDPDLYEEPDLTPMLDGSGAPMQDKYGNPMYKVLNPEKAFYTGSQRVIGEAATLDILKSSTHNFGTVVGHAEGYKQNGEAKYAYLSGDITSAYVASSASYVGRSMLSVFTDDSDYPMYFFVYDNVTPVHGDEDVTMKFLLHSVTEPKIDGARVVIENENGQLVLLNTTENTIESVGGAGKKYWINGVNLYEDTYKGGLSTGSKQDNDDAGKLWGRTEVSASVGKDGNQMLNVMYVADRGQTEMLSAASVESGIFTGAVIGNVAVFFADTSVELATSAVTVEVENDSELVEYYFCGLDAGSWRVLVDGELVGTAYASRATHMITFKAPAGEITIEPGSDIKPPNSGKIVYQNVTYKIANPKYYSYDGITALPTDVENGSNVFLGWYLDPEFTQPIKEIDGSKFTGNLTVFAKFKVVYANENYGWTKDNPTSGKTISANGIEYSGVEDPAVFYETGYEHGRGYVTWFGKTGGPVIAVSTSSDSIANADAMQYTYTFSLAKNGSDTLLSTGARIVSRSGKPNNILSLFSTSNNGNLTVCGKNIPLTNEFYTFSIVVDFERGKLTAYDVTGELIGESNMPLIESATTYEESKTFFVGNILNWRSNGADGQVGSIRIGEIKIEQGGFVCPPDECLHVDVNDDGKCDRCKSDFSDGCNHFDKTDDGKCDKCNEPHEDGCEVHSDKDDNRKCDRCNEDFDDGEELPDGHWRINYLVDDGVVIPTDAPTVHVTGSSTKLPNNPAFGEKVFVGWYLDEAFTMPITEIPADTAAPIILYARWATYVINEDYSWAEDSPLDITDKGFSKNGIEYQKDSAYKTDFTDGDGSLTWMTHGEYTGPVVLAKSFTTDSDNVTYSFSLGAVEGWDLMVTEFRLVGANPGSNKILFNLFKTAKNGKLSILDGEYETVLTADALFSFSITVDYANEAVTAYGADGTVLATKSLPKAPVGENCDTWQEWKNNQTCLMNWRNSTPEGADGAIKIGYYSVIDTAFQSLQ